MANATYKKQGGGGGWEQITNEEDQANIAKVIVANIAKKSGDLDKK